MASSTTNITFGTDGVRGIIAKDFTYDAVRKFAQGVADYLAHKYLRSEKPSVVIGYDRRFMSDRFAVSFAEVLIANGITAVVSSSPLPTPALSLATANGYGLGVMITASHNPALYNGIKIKQEGRSAPANVTAEIENYSTKAIPLKARGLEVPRKDFLKDYIKYIEKKFQPSKLLSKLKGKAVVDFIYGTGAEAIKLIEGKNVIAIRTKHDPLFGGAVPEPSEKNIAPLIEAVKENKALFGIALDGDGDRISLVTEKGQYLTPCQVAPLILKYLISKGKFMGKISQSVSLGYLTRRIARKANIPFEEAPVGFKFIAEKLLHEGAAFAAEESGGYAWKGNQPESDGLVTFLLIAEMLISEKKNLSSLVSNLEKEYGKTCFLRRDIALPKVMPNKHSFAVKVKKKLPKTMLGHKIAETETIDGLKIILENDWWLLMRPSGTELMMRAYAETDSAAETEKMLDLACKLAAVK